MSKRICVLLIAAIALVGCDATQETTTGPDPSYSRIEGIQLVSPLIPDLDAEWAEIARTEVPGFAGYHRSEAGDYVVSVSDLRSAEKARGVVRSRLAGAGRGDRPIRVRQVDYSFDRLNAWKDAMIRVVDGEDVYWLDIDEVANKLVFGVSSPAVRERIMPVAMSEGVPAAAIDVIKTGKPEERVSLTDYSRPVLGGLKIQYTSGYTYTCTHGFNAISGPTIGYVTAAHCSSTKFGVDGTVHYQNVVGSSNRIGYELRDPSSNRRSDAAFFAYDSGISQDWGHIARTTYPAMNQPGSIVINASYPKFRITSKASNSVQVVGELTNKVGQTSGWTQGQVSRTCVTLSSLPCQWEALLWSEPGDSGSPIFKQEGTSEPYASRVALWGVLWGGPAGNWTTTWYSPISGVEQDLGTLTVACDPNASQCYPPPYASISGPTTIKRPGGYTWTANASRGDGSYTYYWEYQRYPDTMWRSGGTGQSVSMYVDENDMIIEFRVTVTSAGMSTTAYHRANIIIGP